MSGALIIVTGTGTGIGKTHIARAILHAARDRSVLGYKPIESGVVDSVGTTDGEWLARASTFHVKHRPELRLRAAISPHLAAEREGVALDWSSVARFVGEVRAQGVDVLVELPGGLFTPLTATARNVDVLASLAPTATLLVAPDRLGVLHDVGAALAGARHVGARLDAIALIAPDVSDASTSTNERELARFVDVPIVGTWPRATPEALAAHDTTMRVLYTYWLSRAR